MPLVDRRFGIRIAHVPVGDQLHAVGIGVDGQDDHVAQEAHRLFVGAADELIDRFHQLLRAEHFGGVQAAVDPHHRLAVASELPRLFVGEALGEREPLGDVLVLLQVLVVLRRGDDRHQLIAALGGLADALQRSCGRNRRRACGRTR